MDEHEKSPPKRSLVPALENEFTLSNRRSEQSDPKLALPDVSEIGALKNHRMKSHPNARDTRSEYPRVEDQKRKRAR